MTPQIKIYTTATCPYCVKAKRFFTEKGLTFEEIDLTDKFAEIDALKKSTGHRTVPQIFIDGKFIGGYTDLMDKVNSGELLLS